MIGRGWAPGHRIKRLELLAPRDRSGGVAFIRPCEPRPDNVDILFIEDLGVCKFDKGGEAILAKLERARSGQQPYVADCLECSENLYH